MLQFEFLTSAWGKLSALSRYLVSLGCLLILIASIAIFFVAPLQNKVAALKTNININKNLLSEMQLTSDKITALDKGKISSPTISVLKMMGLVQASINASPIKERLVDFKQAGDKSVVVRFDEVSFDALTVWLVRFSNDQCVRVEKVDIIELPDSPGRVNAGLSLSL